MNRSQTNHKNGREPRLLKENQIQDTGCPDQLDYVPGLVSVIVPCYNEEENIRDFLRAVIKVSLGSYTCEVIVVNDGSQDRSASILKKVSRIYPFLRVYHFPRNFGQQEALMAGIKKARGELLVTIDMDLQQPPALIPDMIRLYRQGYQVVHAIPEYHHSVTLFKNLTSKLYYKIIAFISGEQVVYKSNEFRMFSHRIARVIRIIPEKSLYLRGIIMWLCPLDMVSEKDNFSNVESWRATTVRYQHQARVHGKTKYSVFQLVALAFDGMTTISIKPLRYGLFLGVASILLAVGLAIWALSVHWFTDRTVPGWTSLMIVLLFFGSIQFLLLGLIGEYIGKIFIQVRGRPGHVIQVPDLSEDPTHMTLPFQEKRTISNQFFNF